MILGNRKGFKAKALELENTEAELSVLFLMAGVLVEEEERAGEAQGRGGPGQEGEGIPTRWGEGRKGQTGC